MGTYDFTVGGPIGLPFQYKARNYWVPILIDVPAIIAANATLTTAAKLTAGDILQIFDIPAATLITGIAVLETITVGQAGNTADIGVAAGDELFNGVALDSVAGTRTLNLHTDDWGALNGYVVSTTDTLDMLFVADATTGKYVVWVEIVDLNKSGMVEGY